MPNAPVQAAAEGLPEINPSVDALMAQVDELSPLQRFWFEEEVRAMSRDAPNAFDGTGERTFEKWLTTDAGKAAKGVLDLLVRKIDFISWVDRLHEVVDLLAVIEAALSGLSRDDLRSGLDRLIGKIHDITDEVADDIDVARQIGGAA